MYYCYLVGVVFGVGGCVVFQGFELFVYVVVNVVVGWLLGFNEQWW